MPRFSAKEIKIKLKAVFWDNDISADELYEIYMGRKKNAGSVNRVIIYTRLLNTYDWYTLLKIVPPQKWKEMLSDNVLAVIFPKSLKNKYFHVRRLLFE
ncbi:MAG TPA: hypothetical protein PLC90_09410 [Bacteroidales bacterium]|nr:hypothetical protein [Bacteroidales bacterium]